ncbi:MAG TPA: chemotaxis protein CheX [Desulfohalobiaceae bacterium]|nr:chemotaxis protein CheX [Desulfohalobiaceae bacterium]
MEKNWQSVVSDVLTEVLEEFAFIFVETEPDEEIEEPDEVVYAEINFNGQDVEGVLGIAVSWQKCLELADNLLGADEQENLSERAVENALEELVNVVCGRLLAELYGTNVIFDLSIPETKALSKKKWNNLMQSEETVLVYEEDEPLAIYLSVR